MANIPRFAILIAGIAIAGAGGLAFNLGVDGRVAAAIGVAGVVLAAVEFAPIERGREKTEADAGKQLAAMDAELKAEGFDPAAAKIFDLSEQRGGRRDGL